MSAAAWSSGCPAIPSRLALAFALVTSSLVGVPTVGHAQEGVEPAALADDFQRLVDLVEETHPDPYTAFGGVEGFRERAARLRREARDLRTVAGLHALAQRFLATLRDGHTSMSALPEDGGGRSDRWAPLRLGVATDALYVRSAVPELARHVGSRVLGIDHLPVEDVVDSVRIRYPSENAYGGMERLRRVLAVKRGSWPDFLETEGPLPLTLETPRGDTVALDMELTRERPDLASRPSSLDVAGDNGLLWGRIIERGDRPVGYFAWNAVVSREVADEAYRRDPDMATIPRGTFDWVLGYLPEVERTGDPEKDLDLMPSLYERFSRLLGEMESRGAEYLVLDLRNNSGGMTPLIYTLLYMLYGDALLTADLEARYDVRLSELYLAKMGMEDIAEYNASRGTDLSLGDMRRGHLFRNDLSLPLDERRRKAADELTFGGYGAEYWQPHDDGPPSPRVVVLTSPRTFSAAFHFTYFLSEIGSAVVVGVPPRQAPNAFMEATRFELPGSGLRGSISNAVQVLYPADDPRAKLFTPDFPMSWEDFRRYDFDPDAEVLYALDLIEAGRIPGPR